MHRLAVELHLPVTVVRDLVGEHTEELTLNNQPATLWYSPEGWAQVRGQWGPTGESGGGNARLAMDVARRLRFVPPDESVQAVAAYYDAIKASDRTAALALVVDQAQAAFVPSLDELLAARPGFVVHVAYAPEAGSGLIGVIIRAITESPLRFTPACRFYVSTTRTAGATLLDGMTSCTAPPPN